MKKTRKAHLWIGLITSVFLLMEAITGLVLSEPWLVGQQGHGEGEGHRSAMMGSSFAEGGSTAPAASTGESSFQKPNFKEGGPVASLYGTIRGLHEGKLGGANIKWVIDIAALSMIFLTVSGIYLSLKILLAQRKVKRRKLQAALE
ncbi:PepSY-associated TM helix domain-containing protein [Priestia koreensis]|uniref:Uncharacterized protein n=1 Tax=Priestia koreensis TaxID=284581 RepID=A0A0M0KQR0_9BACI|nr:PepSY-associated TM helix domain-containing protein [Priestia koreensis]KOO41149.1 hypothetical protein AMD01_19610 [Priestia koreensis]